MGKENDLLEAARTGNVVTIGKLLSNRGRNVLSQALSFRRALGPNCQDTSGYTPLHHAVLNGHRDAVQMLLKFDASPTVPDNRGSNPLHLAAWTGNVEIVQTLLTSTLSQDQVNEQNNYWDTPLHFAAQYGHTEVVSLLLEHGADPTLCNRKEEGPLDLAAQYGRFETVQQLVRLRPDLLAKIPESRSLLHLAAKNGHHRIVKLLLEAGCDIHKTTKTGTALHEASVFGRIEVVRVLLEHRPAVDVEITDGHSETALQKIESHSSKVSQDISKMIMAHIRGEPLPSSVEPSPSSPMTDTDSSNSDPTAGPGPAFRPNPGLSMQDMDTDNHQNIYDNVPEDRSYQRHYPHPELNITKNLLSSSPKSTRASVKPHRVPPAQPEGDLYMNVNLLSLARNMPPKKPQRASIGILLDQVPLFNENSPQAEKKPLLATPAVHLDVCSSQYSNVSTMSSQDSDSPPPLPDRNYYDLDQAGEYTQLRRDAPPPRQLRDKEFTSQQQDCDAMNEGLSNTSTETSDDTRGSLYETLSNAQSGAPTPDAPFPPYEMESRCPNNHSHHPAIQLHIHEPDDDADLNTTCEGEYHLDHDDDQDLDAYELLSEATTGGGSSKGRPKPKPRITPTSSSSSSVPSNDSASPVHKPVPLPRRNKPVPAKRSPGSISSQPSTPSEELTSSTASDHWGSPLERPSTPDQPPPSPHTAMMGIQAKLNASEAQAQCSDYDNPDDLSPCACSVGQLESSNCVFFPTDEPSSHCTVHSRRDTNSTKHSSHGHLRKLELDLANRSRKFHEFEAAADQLQTRLEKWQARVEESHLNRVNRPDSYGHGSIYESVLEGDAAQSSYDDLQRRSFDNAAIVGQRNGNHKVVTRQNSSPTQTRAGFPRKPKRQLNAQLSLNVLPPGHDNPPPCYTKPSLPPKKSHSIADNCSTLPNGRASPSIVSSPHLTHESPQLENGRSHLQQNVQEPPIVPHVIQKDDPLAWDNRLLEGNSQLEILKPNASHPFAGSIGSQFSGLIYGSSRGSRSLSLSQQDHRSHFRPGLDRAIGRPARMSGMSGTMTDGKTDDQGVGIDESSEWEQIESIMNSFGAGLVRESVYVRDFQKDFEKMFEGPGRPQSVGEWLDSLNLGQYENMLIANGFDHLDFIGGDIIEEQDLMDIGIVEEIHRKMILEATKCLPIMKPIGLGPEFTPKPASVSDWLRSLLLSDYITNFLENNISTMERALDLWEFELENVLEIPMLGHRKRLLASLGDRRRSRHSSTVDIEVSRPHSLDIDITSSDDLVRSFEGTRLPGAKAAPREIAAIGRKVDPSPERATTKDTGKPSENTSAVQELQIESFVGPEEREEMRKHTSLSSSLDIDLFKDYSREVTSPTRNSTSSVIAEEGALHPSEEEEFRTLIETTEAYARQNGDSRGLERPKERRMVGSTSSEEGQKVKENGSAPGKKHADPPGQQWMHPPDALIKGCCNYTSSYLGSSIIKELHGTESTREACTRLRRSALHVQKMPAITLSINYAGVKFIDSKSKMVITEHEICNISCVAQDSDDLKTFAYITKDNQYEKLYCHVFTVKSVELATEIILTLGQAFEIAYKMLLKTARGSDHARHHHSNGTKGTNHRDEMDAPVCEDTRL